jgi:phosphohistidine phosphatase
MTLYLVQHGDTVPEAADAARPLSEKGRQDVRVLAEVLARAGVAGVRILHSGKLRARQTAEIIAARVAPGAAIETASGLDPNDEPAAAARSLAVSSGDLVVVSHMPLVAKLATLLVTGKTAPVVVAFQPGAAVALARDEGSWLIAWLMRPGLAP